MDKNKIFSKLNIKNYNNQLEEILEKKKFSEEVKNLLLSMLYKIENAYKDYKAVKVEVLPQRDFISYIIKIIKEMCLEIEILSPKKEEKIEVNKEKGLIRCYPNEMSLLSAIWYMGQSEPQISFKYECAKDAIQKLIKIGSNCNQTEILRDFNGWSWDIVVKQIEDVSYNVLYQSLLLLDGRMLIYTNINSINDEIKNSIILQENNKEYEKFLTCLANCALYMYKLDDSEAKEQFEKIKKEKIEELELFENKREFVQKISDDKKQYLAKIERIDRTINSTEMLTKEYKARNALLPNKEKIFSISYLEDILEKERAELLESIKRCNKMIEPKGFVKEKEKLSQEVNFLSEEKSIIDCCKEFFKCAKKQVEKSDNKEEIINWIYKIRYYGYIPYDEEKSLKDLKELKKEFKDMIKLLIKKAQQYKVWDNFAENQEIAYLVISELLNSKMINLENVNIVCRYENGILYLEYYDGNILEKKAEIKITNVRIKKKIKLFV